MLFNIPQFIDKEDKIVGPLTAKQLGWLGAAGAMMLILWTLFDFSTVLLAAIPVLGVFGALAFYHPNGQPLIGLVFSSITYVFHPKAYIWRRVQEKEIIQKKAPTIDVVKVQRAVTEDRLEEISKLLDRR